MNPRRDFEKLNRTGRTKLTCKFELGEGWVVRVRGNVWSTHASREAAMREREFLRWPK